MGLFRGARRVARDGNAGERGFLLGFLLGAVLVEAIGAQLGAESEMRRGIGRLQRRRIAEIDRKGSLALAGAVEMGDEVPAEILQQPLVDLIGLAEAGDDDAAEWQVGRADDRDQLVLLAVEPRRRGDRAADRAAGCLVEPPRRGGQRPFLQHADDNGARPRQREFGETDLHAATPGQAIQRLLAR